MGGLLERRTAYEILHTVGGAASAALCLALTGEGSSMRAKPGSFLARRGQLGLPLVVCALAVLLVSQRYWQGVESGVSEEAAVRPQAPGAVPGASGDSRPPATGDGQADRLRRGLIMNTGAAFAGYTLFAPLHSTTTYLVDMAGRLVHSWPSRYEPGQAAYLLEDGSLLRAGREPGNRHFGGGGIGGRVERIAPDGTVIWEYVCADEQRCQHHDIKPLPNGNVLLIVWEKKTQAEALAAGRDPRRMTGEELWPDCIIEVKPEGATGGRIVWEWHVWDHLVQDVDPGLPNYGMVADHPELIDVNYRRSVPRAAPAELRRLRSLGYVGGAVQADEEEAEGHLPGMVGAAEARHPDWCHTNALDYNARLDQIALSVHVFNEVWIIDHSTTTAEAAGHRGGRYGKGGDLLYRWGNPRAYGAGGTDDQQFFAQHDVRWIPEGAPGAGHLMVFNNGPGRPAGRYSSVVEIAPPVDAAGRYRLERGKAFGPAAPVWEYTAPNKVDFFSSHISGAERLPNGNTLICSGEQGRVFEVNASGGIVWEYVNPYIEHPRPAGLFGPFAGAAGKPWFRDRPPREFGHPGPPADVVGGERSGQRPPPPGGPWGPPPGGPGGPPGDAIGGLFRAARLAPNHPGVQRLLQAGGRHSDGGS